MIEKKIKFTKESLLDFIKKYYVFTDWDQTTAIFQHMVNVDVEKLLKKYRVISLYDVAKIIFERVPSYENVYRIENYEFEYDCYTNGYILEEQNEYKPIAYFERIDNVDKPWMNRKWFFRLKLVDTVDIKGV